MVAQRNLPRRLTGRGRHGRQLLKQLRKKIKVADTAEKKAVAAEKNRALAEKRSAKLLAKQNEMDVKLAKAISLNTAQAEELADLRAALEASEEKWYNEGFANAENSAEPIVNQARRLGFEAGWFAALQILGVHEDSPLRDLIHECLESILCKETLLLLIRIEG